MSGNSKPVDRDYHVEQEMSFAIRNKRIVRLRYDLDLRDRVFEPYVLFKSRDGRVMVGGRRVLDENDLFKPPAMRQFEVGLVNNLEVTEETFAIDDRFDSGNLSKSNEIIASVDRPA